MIDNELYIIDEDNENNTLAITQGELQKHYFENDKKKYLVTNNKIYSIHGREGRLYIDNQFRCYLLDMFSNDKKIQQNYIIVDGKQLNKHLGCKLVAEDF